jgi:hypothetical protein
MSGSMEARGRGSSHEPDKTLRMAWELGIKVPLGESFPCVLPGCSGHTAKLHPTRPGYWQYRCEGYPRSFGLAEVRAFLAYGDVRTISDTAAARWRDRLEYDAGLRGPLGVNVVLPPDSSDSLEKVAMGLRRLVGLRDPEIWSGKPFLYTRSFVVAWAGVSSDQARRGVRQLEQLGVIKRVGRRRVDGGFEAIEWQLGDGWQPRTLLEELGTEDAVVEEFRRAFDAHEEPA